MTINNHSLFLINQRIRVGRDITPQMEADLAHLPLVEGVEIVPKYTLGTVEVINETTLQVRFDNNINLSHLVDGEWIIDASYYAWRRWFYDDTSSDSRGARNGIPFTFRNGREVEREACHMISLWHDLEDGTTERIVEFQSFRSFAFRDVYAQGRLLKRDIYTQIEEEASFQPDEDEPIRLYLTRSMAHCLHLESIMTEDYDPNSDAFMDFLSERAARGNDALLLNNDDTLTNFEVEIKPGVFVGFDDWGKTNNHGLVYYIRAQTLDQIKEAL